MNSDNNSQSNQSSPSSAEAPISGVQTRSMAAIAQPPALAQPMATTQPPALAQSPSVATQAHASAAEVIINDHINLLGMELARAVINQNNSLVDSLLAQITTARTALLALNGNGSQTYPTIAPSSASSASNGSSTIFSTEKRILSCMDKLPLWKSGHDPLLGT